MDNSSFECFLTSDYGHKALYIEGLNILITSWIKCKRIVSDKKVKSVEKLLAKFKKVGVLRVRKVNYSKAFFERRLFMIKQFDIMELLDEQGYEIRS